MPFLSYPHGTKVPYTAVGSAGKFAFDYVTRRFNAFSAELKKLVGLILRWGTALRDLHIRFKRCTVIDYFIPHQKV
jgi:hypothetical protein